MTVENASSNLTRVRHAVASNSIPTHSIISQKGGGVLNHVVGSNVERVASDNSKYLRS